MVVTAESLRNLIYSWLSGEYETMGEELPHAEKIDEDGTLKVMFIDDDANCFRITVEAI